MKYDDFDKRYPVKMTVTEIPERPDGIEWMKDTGHWLIQLKIDSDHHICFLYSMDPGNKEQRSTGVNPPFKPNTVMYVENAYWPEIELEQALNALVIDAGVVESCSHFYDYLEEFHNGESHTAKEFKQARRSYEASKDNKEKLIKLLGVEGYELLMTVERL